MPKITYLPLGIVAECSDGETVFAVAQRAKVPIPTACAGKASCGLCRVKIVAGEQSLPPIGREETKHLGNTYFITKLRLSCQARVHGDVTVALPDLTKRK